MDNKGWEWVVPKGTLPGNGEWHKSILDGKRNLKVKEQLVKIKSSGTLIFNNKIILITYDKNLISP